MNLVQAEKEIIKTNKEKESYLNKINNKLKKLEHRKKLITNNIDYRKIEQAKKLIEIYYDEKVFLLQEDKFRDEIKDIKLDIINHGEKLLKKKYSLVEYYCSPFSIDGFSFGLSLYSLNKKIIWTQKDFDNILYLVCMLENPETRKIILN